MDVLYAMKREMLRRHYSRKTIKTYVSCFKQFMRWCGKEPRRITKKDVSNYLVLLAEKNSAASTLNVHLQSIKFVMDNLLGKRLWIRLPYAKKPARLPEILSREEVARLLDVVTNPKHRLMVAMLYAAGLRVSELVKLRVRDLDLVKGEGWVRGGKGDKDRPFIIARGLMRALAQQIEGEGGGRWVFPGMKGTHYSPQSIRMILKNAAKRVGIKKRVHPHMLRHSFATHLLENGEGVAGVQGMLGHNSMETTMGYVHLARPFSPSGALRRAVGVSIYTPAPFRR